MLSRPDLSQFSTYRAARLLLIVWGGAAILAGMAGAEVLRWSPAPVVAVVNRPLSTLWPPQDYDTDRLRTAGLVTEALCPGAPGFEGRAAARRCDVGEKPGGGRALHVQLRPAVIAGGRGHLTPPAVVGVLDATRRRLEARGDEVSWEKALVGEAPASVWVVPGVRSAGAAGGQAPVDRYSPEELRSDLQQTAVDLSLPASTPWRRGAGGQEQPPPCPSGTGPFEVIGVWSRTGPEALGAAETRRLGTFGDDASWWRWCGAGGARPALEGLPSALRPFVTDVTVERRCQATGALRLKKCQPLHLWGMSVPASSALHTQAAAGLADGLAAGGGHRIDVVSRIDQDLLRALRSWRRTPPVARQSPAGTAASPLLPHALEVWENRDTWDLQSRADRDVLWLVANPRLDAAVRATLLRAAQKALTSPSFRMEVEGSDAPFLVPLGLLREAEGALFGLEEPRWEAPPGVALPAHIRVLTNRAWAPIAFSLRERLTDLGIEVVALDPKEEAACRSAGDWDLSLLALGTSLSRTPAEFLAANMPAWFLAPPTERGGCPAEVSRTPAPTALPGDASELLSRARALRRKELLEPPPAAVGALLTDLGGYVTPVASPYATSASRLDLVGWRTQDGRFAPEILRRTDEPPSTALPFALGLLAVAAYFGAALIRKVDEAQRTRAAREVALLHHDAVSPLATLKAEVSEGVEDLELRRTLMDLADESIDVMDELGVIVDPLGLAESSLPPGGSVGDALRGVQATLGGRAAELGGTLEIEVPVDLEAVRVTLPADSLRRVLRNLVVNSLLHGAVAGPPTVVVRAQAEGASFIRMTVEDAGPGIPEELLPSLFSFGRQGPGPRRGRGLGLYGVRTLVEAGGGTVRVASARRPTVIEISLPRHSRG